MKVDLNESWLKCKIDLCKYKTTVQNSLKNYEKQLPDYNCLKITPEALDSLLFFDNIIILDFELKWIRCFWSDSRMVLASKLLYQQYDKFHNES